MKMDREFQTLMPPLLKEEKEKLTESIKQEGVREPLILWKGILIDGYNRKEIADKLKIKYKTSKKKFDNREEVILWIINNQLGRRNISNYDRTRLALRYEEVISPGQGARTELSQKSDKVDTKKEIGKIAKVSHDTVSKVKFIEQYAKPEQKKRLSTQQDSINKVYHEIRKKITTTKKVTNLPKEPFDVIYADPPWKYNFSQTNERSIETHYSSMSLEQIKDMRVSTSKNAVLLLWTTAPKLQETFEVINKWGFEYKTCAVWDKEIIGMGYWFRGQHEILLLATKGKVNPPIPKNRFSSVIKTKRSKHSKKPEIVYEMIEKMFPNLKYIELFARQKRKNWECWGDEI